MSDLFSLSPSAVARLEHLCSVEKKCLYLRIRVESGGCAGFQYLFSLEKEYNPHVSQENDVVFYQGQGRVVIDKESLVFLKGACLEYREDMMEASFYITNPQQTLACGCGTSFSVF